MKFVGLCTRGVRGFGPFLFFHSFVDNSPKEGRKEITCKDKSQWQSNPVPFLLGTRFILQDIDWVTLLCTTEMFCSSMYPGGDGHLGDGFRVLIKSITWQSTVVEDKSSEDSWEHSSCLLRKCKLHFSAFTSYHPISKIVHLDLISVKPFKHLSSWCSSFGMVHVRRLTVT